MHYLIGSGEVEFTFVVVPGINYAKCNAALFTSSTSSSGTFATDTNATINMDLTVDP
jgi:hypothetical protein